MHEGHDANEPVSSDVNLIGKAVLDAAFAVHSELGPGLLESVYEHCLDEELRAAGLAVERQVAIPVSYRSSRLDVGFRLDLLGRAFGYRRNQIDRRLGVDPCFSGPDLPEIFESAVRLFDQFQHASAEGWASPPRQMRRSRLFRRDLVVFFVIPLCSL